MRLSTVRAGFVAAAAALALAACGGQNVGVPATSGALNASLPGDLLQPLTGCATSPPQYYWIFKGACDAKIMLKATGGTFSLADYDDITVKGSIGKNNAKGTVTIALADATDTNGDIVKYKGAAFLKYKAKGTTFIYAVAVNQSTQTIKPIAEKDKPILQYVITDSKGLPGKSCGAAVLTEGSRGSEVWSTIPASFKVSGHTLTISQYNVPNGFEFGPKSPLYFAINCFS